MNVPSETAGSLAPASSRNWLTDPLASARVALACLDLTSLNAQDTEADIAALCARAQGLYGPVAAVCVWPRLAAFARKQLPPSIAVAAVANFPEGSADVERAVRETGAIVQSGAQEVDLVLPYAQLLAGEYSAVSGMLVAVRKASRGLILKVILETGALVGRDHILRASRLSHRGRSARCCSRRFQTFGRHPHRERRGNLHCFDRRAVGCCGADALALSPGREQPSHRYRSRAVREGRRCALSCG